LIFTSSNCELQAPDAVHLNLLVPLPKPVTVEVGLFGLVIVPVPVTKVHVPVSGAVIVEPARVALVTLHKFWSGPAFTMVTLPADAVIE
jgi:hypothetical protein